MTTPYLGQIMVTAFNFPPRGWALCNGQLLPINQNQALFSLLGTTYGGNGETNFALPNLQARVPLHPGNGVVLGEAAGEAVHTLTYAEMPEHNHLFGSVNQASTTSPAGAAFAAMPRRGVPLYAAPGAPVQINDGTESNTGGSQPHTNMQPYLTLNFVIALEGIFPTRN